ncbi:hypothetical protein TNCV_3713141 [Trichonephila clavipes]|nr:hypothetical protein TNCV_3713141 [Trichonephila clavipes]
MSLRLLKALSYVLSKKIIYVVFKLLQSEMKSFWARGSADMSRRIRCERFFKWPPPRTALDPVEWTDRKKCNLLFSPKES